MRKQWESKKASKGENERWGNEDVGRKNAEVWYVRRNEKKKKKKEGEHVGKQKNNEVVEVKNVREREIRYNKKINLIE